MGIEVPQGDALAPPEQSKPETNNATTTSNTKKFVLVAVLISLVLAAVLIGVIPDWGEKKDNELESSDETTDASKPSSINGTKVERETGNGTFPSISYLESSSGPFNVRIPLFSSKITEGYSSEQELGLDLEQLAKFLLNDAITTNAAAGVYSGDDGEKFVGEGGTLDMGVPEAAPVSDEQTADSAFSGSASQGSNALDGVDSFNTNNQELSVDRADFVKSDGTYIYAAYGDYLVVWTIDGSGIISKIQMPPLNLPNWGGGVVDDPIMLGEDTASSGSTTSATDSNATAEMPVADAGFGMIWWQPKPRIEALLLHEGRLTVVISGYGMEYADKLGYTPVLYDYRGTKIQVYDINDGNLQIVSEGDVNGSFRNAYSAGENAYVVTQSSINTWDYLLAPVQRWQPAFVGMDNETYVQAVVKLVDEGLVQKFVDELLSELRVNGQIDLARLSAFTDSIAEDHSDAPLYSGGVANAVTQVVSFDMTLGSSTDIQPLSPHVSGTFHPGSWGNVYAVSSMIIVADQGWSWIPADNLAVDKTYLIGFRLDGPSSTHAMIGSVDGYLLNPFSLDFVEKAEGSYVRIATTQNFWTPWFGGPIAMEGGEGMIMEADSESVTQDVAPEEPVEPKSSTLNQIIVLKVPSTLTDGETVLEQVGSVELGEPNERFTSVRFFDDFAYAVTFEQIDPFYVVDLSSEQPEVVGALKVNGFSEYMHPIDSENRFLVAIGQEADDNGNVLGYMVSLFDATTPSKPTLVDRLVVEQEQNSWSSSTASWDERAFRFVPLGDKQGKLIIPMSIYTWQEFDQFTGQALESPISKNFEGFSVFNIENGVITKDFDVDHSYEAPNNNQCGYWYDWLPERSFVFSGNLVTMKKHTIISTSLATGATSWTTKIDDVIVACAATQTEGFTP